MDQAQNAREKYEGICALLEAGKDRKIGGHAFWWLISAGPEYAADLAFYQEDSEERIAGDPDEDEVAAKARTLERKLVARLGDRKELTVGAFLEHFDWLVEEAEVAHDGRYEPRERLLKKLHGMAQVGYNNALERARKTDAEITDLRGDRMLPSEAALQRIARYEAHLSREMYKSLHELEALQGRRPGSPHRWRASMFMGCRQAKMRNEFAAGRAADRLPERSPVTPRGGGMDLPRFGRHVSVTRHPVLLV